RGRPRRRGAAAGAGRPPRADQRACLAPGGRPAPAPPRRGGAADLAVVLADGGDCLSDLAVLRDQPALFGPVASTPTAWRVVERTATDPDGLAHLRAARAHARARAWAVGGDRRSGCWSSTPTRRWCWPTATPSRARRAPTSTPSGSRRCWPTWTA